MNDNNIIKPSELIEMMKKRSLSVEQLKEIIPMTNEYLSGLFNALVAEIQSSKDCHLESLRVLDETNKLLVEIARVENCSEEIRVTVINKIAEIAKLVYTIETKREENSHQFLMRLTSILGGIVFIVLFFSGNNSSEK